jgi:hypothetical protein
MPFAESGADVSLCELLGFLTTFGEYPYRIHPLFDSKSCSTTSEGLGGDMAASYRQWIYAKPMAGDKLGPEHFELREQPIPELKDGQALVRVKLINVHSNTRTRLALGMTTLGDTERSNYACEWTYVFRPAMVRMWPSEVLMDLFGTSGLTAYFGMRQCGPLMPRDAVLVAGATGSVGSIAAQLARIAGLRPDVLHEALCGRAPAALSCAGGRLHPRRQLRRHHRGGGPGRLAVGARPARTALVVVSLGRECPRARANSYRRDLSWSLQREGAGGLAGRNAR